jgi:hypothetical protein
MKAPSGYCQECYKKKKRRWFEPDPRFSRKYPMVNIGIGKSILACLECGNTQAYRRLHNTNNKERHG